MMNRTFVLGLAAAGLVSAKTTVTSMFFYDTDAQSLDASIMGNDATATTYSVNCPPGTDSDDCGMGPGMTVIAGPQTTMFMDIPDEDFYYTVICSLDGTTYAVCSEMASGAGANFPGTTITTLDEGDLGLMPVTITAGSVTSVAATAAHATTEVQSASNTGSSASSGTETQSAASTGTSASASASTAVSTASNASKASASAISTGRGSLVTGDAALVFGGAAAAALVAAVL
ncbi:hypothetical protein BO94DRAFT_490860 [Aspergillus sclerotioniger CBS 115572]|uniref:GPI anchored protein n=1 Tax=Aspergillus sclerotioniger CBS 115572 TaxID=1450535 RepID=A0A317WUE4_9EURO|nr:hypothetical protein BO94DRAFT_490860 [Aspergillus sclerotioniger CBS 115572]PWY89695.1 hypothetical protein BO94DRAFT_490860 [Aspergillus sclerotioniger CBS 115572]